MRCNEAAAAANEGSGRCLGCAEQLLIGELIVRVDRCRHCRRACVQLTAASFVDGPEYFHPSCLLCSQCGVLLVDMRCFVDIGKVAAALCCETAHLAARRSAGVPAPSSGSSADGTGPTTASPGATHAVDACTDAGRCSGCDETIFEKEYVFEGERAYHKRHFCCMICDTNLTSLTAAPLLTLTQPQRSTSSCRTRACA